jgi:hypothetical protein
LTVDIPLVISAVSPDTDLNPAGGNVLTITGENFPSTLTEVDSFQITLSGTTEPCLILSTSFTTITCLTGKLDETSPSATLTIEVND